MDEWLCSSTHNKDDVKALDKCAPPGRFISFVPLESNWNKNMAYWCDRGTPLGWMKIFQWKQAANGDLSKLLNTPLGLCLELQNVD